MRMLRPYFKYIASIVAVFALIIAGSLPELSAVQDIAAISIDESRNGGYIFGFELAVSDKSDNFTVKSVTMQVQASTLDEAIELAGLQNEYPLTLTHCSLVVIGGKLLGEMEDISAMLIAQWQGQCEVYLVLADGCKAVEILEQDNEQNLRAGLLSRQIKRACLAGTLSAKNALASASEYLDGRSVALPLVALSEDGYRISGQVKL